MYMWLSLIHVMGVVTSLACYFWVFVFKHSD